MFAGLPFLEPGKLGELGFSTKREARKAYFHRARLLYDLDAESDSLATLQTALLLTSWYESPDDNKGSWHWLGIAISISFSLGLQAKVLETAGNRRANRLRRRIWWACYMRDRMIALNMSRLMRIRDDEFNIPMLVVDDFDIVDTDGDSPGMGSIFLDTTTQTALAEMFIFMAELCVPIGNILSLYFSTLPPEGQESHTATKRIMMNRGTMLFPKFEADVSERVMMCDAYIQQLFSARPASCIYSTPRAESFKGHGTSLLVHRSFLHMSFFAVISALHRPQLKSKSHPQITQPMFDVEAKKLSQRRFHEAGKEISRVCHDLWRNNVEYLLPPAAVLIQIPAIMTHMPRILSRQLNPENQHDPLRAMFYSLKICETLQAAHPGVDTVMAFLQTVLNAAKIEIVKDGDLKIIDLLCRKEKDGIALPKSCGPKDLQIPTKSAPARSVSGQLSREHLTWSADAEAISGETAALAAEDPPGTDGFHLITARDELFFVDLELADVFADGMATEETFDLPLSMT
ncbi:uncharacterized protein A1O9_03802 [Exophiala aquamarina CBS 119918]|uniref:Xylanolytic transcriptional activator regulatory domain-containing protein n=1 Tax=Exophiala aquamarina CBS 119918 TaxID=1182545 RepID=A0A072PFQ9_9EURO|nr:uncharacterized protein A1O9_03802 [Exophiala aquamarina CBS 119918]KEF58959.1 hypothetical protein A1O9_03802 [Exophiala aquamarina CBS 119918]